MHFLGTLRLLQHSTPIRFQWTLQGPSIVCTRPALLITTMTKITPILPRIVRNLPTRALDVLDCTNARTSHWSLMTSFKQVFGVPSSSATNYISSLAQRTPHGREIAETLIHASVNPDFCVHGAHIQLRSKSFSVYTHLACCERFVFVKRILWKRPGKRNRTIPSTHWHACV